MDAALLATLDPPLDPPPTLFFPDPPPLLLSPSLLAVSLLDPELTPLELLTLPPLPPLSSLALWMARALATLMGMDLTDPARLLVHRVPLGPTLRLAESRQRLEARMLARMLCLLPRRTERK